MSVLSSSFPNCGSVHGSPRIFLYWFPSPSSKAPICPLSSSGLATIDCTFGFVQLKLRWSERIVRDDNNGFGKSAERIRRPSITLS